MLPRRKMIVIFFVISIGLFALSYYPAQTSVNATLTFTVNSNVDLPDFATNGVCSVGHETNGLCTLRAAITEARGNAHEQPVTVRIPPGTYTLTIPPDPDIAEDYRHGDLDINPNSPTNHLITIESTVVGGEVIIQTAPDFHDRILEIRNANVSIEGVVFSGAHLEVSPAQFGGAAINNHGTLKLVGTKFVNNSVSCKPGEDCKGYVYGGAIENFGTLSIFDSSFVQNSTDRGGSAIFTNGPSVNISYSSFLQNSTLTIVNYSSFSIVNSTLSGGESGILNYEELFLRSCTMANFNETIRNYSGKTVYARDSIFSTQGQYNFNGSQGVWNSGGYNIFNDGSWPGDYSTGDLSNTDPKLGMLGNYGGPTLTHPLQPGSPAIDHRPGNCGSVFLPLFEDQRHFPRNDGKCDTGAFEHTGVFFVPLFLPAIFR